MMAKTEKLSESLLLLFLLVSAGAAIYQTSITGTIVFLVMALFVLARIKGWISYAAYCGFWGALALAVFLLAPFVGDHLIGFLGALIAVMYFVEVGKTKMLGRTCDHEDN